MSPGLLFQRLKMLFIAHSMSCHPYVIQYKQTRKRDATSIIEEENDSDFNKSQNNKCNKGQPTYAARPQTPLQCKKIYQPAFSFRGRARANNAVRNTKHHAMK